MVIGFSKPRYNLTKLPPEHHLNVLIFGTNIDRLHLGWTRSEGNSGCR